MKKVLFVVLAMVAIGFTSCGNKAQAPADNTEAVAQEDVETAISDMTAALSEQIEAKDASKFQEGLNSVQEKIKEFLANDPEAAKLYVTKVQEFLKENAEKIKAFVGDNQVVNNTVTALTTTPAESILSSLATAVDGLNQAGQAAVDTLNKAGQAAVDGAKKAAEDQANAAVDDAKQKANDAIDKGADKLKKGLGL